MKSKERSVSASGRLFHHQVCAEQPSLALSPARSFWPCALVPAGLFSCTTLRPTSVGCFADSETYFSKQSSIVASANNPAPNLMHLARCRLSPSSAHARSCMTPQSAPMSRRFGQSPSVAGTVISRRLVWSKAEEAYPRSTCRA